MAGLNFIDRGRPVPKRAEKEYVENLTQTEVKPKRKRSFDFLFPAPKGQKNMGMDFNGVAFEGVL